MKQVFKSLASFSRTERIGLAGLLIVLIILLTIRATMHYWVKPETDRSEQDKLAATWQSFQKQAYGAPLKSIDSAAQAVLSDSSQNQHQLFYFDPNTLDSSGFRLLGLSEKTTAILLHWRAKGKHFYKKEELKALYSLSSADYVRLAPYIRISDDNKVIHKIELNSADSEALIRLKGIGPATAHKILEHKRNRGSFGSFDDLNELCHFPDKTLQYLQQHISITQHR